MVSLILARVRDSENLFQSNVCDLFFAGDFNCCPYYRGVRNSEVFAWRELTVARPPLLEHTCRYCFLDVYFISFSTTEIFVNSSICCVVYDVHHHYG